jgi:hypothetical protein
MNISRRAAGRALSHPVRAFKCLGTLFPEFNSRGVYVKYTSYTGDTTATVLLFCGDTYSYLPASPHTGDRDSFSDWVATYWFYPKEEYT